MVTLASDPQIDLFPPGDAARLTTPDAQMVLDALADPKWDFRTIGGIAKETRLSDECVSEILSSFPQLVRRSLLTDSKGRPLYTLKLRGETKQEKRGLLRMFFTKSR